MNIYIANLNSNINNEALKKLFSPYGNVLSARIAMDLFTNESRGFGYVRMEHDEEGQKAIQSLHGSEVEAFILDVKEAAPELKHKGSYKVGSGPVNTFRFKKN